MRTSQNNKHFPAKRIAADSVLIAAFFVLSLLSVEVSGLKITFDAIPVVLAAMLFGPADAFLVGFLGALLEQMLHYGFTVTTVLWILPPALRGLVIGLGAIAFRRRVDWQPTLRGTGLVLYFLLCLFAAAVTSCGNTLVYYVDSKLYGYYQYALIFGIFFVRLGTGLLTGALCALAALPILAALRRAPDIKEITGGDPS